VKLDGCAAVQGRRVFTYRGEDEGLKPVEVAAGAPVKLPAYSISVIELSLVKK